MCATVEGRCLEYLVCITLDETKNFGRCHNWRQQTLILPKDPIQNSLVESNQNLNLWFSVKLRQDRSRIFGGKGI